MAILKCKMCGGQLDIQDGQTVIECDYCGTKQTVPTLDNEKKLNLFNRANRLRMANEFDNAAGIYETIVAEFPEESEAYWGLVLCKNGIEYVDDPKTGNKIPTCHRTSYESVFDDSNFEMVMENADAVARVVYREEAKVIEEIRKEGVYKKASALLNEKTLKSMKEAKELYLSIEGYKDSKDQIIETKYQYAVKLIDNKKYKEAKVILKEIYEYKDSAEKKEECDINIYAGFKAAQVGDVITFGSYEQDNNLNNGQEDIEWIVLRKEGSNILVISKYGLDCKPYNTEDTSVTWETCTLRKWLNDDFVTTAFTTYEKGMIRTVTVSADKNPYYSTAPGNSTQDQVFLLSIKEANTYFSSYDQRECQPTEYAVANGVRVSSDDGDCWWWLRSPGDDHSSAAYVYLGGSIEHYGFYVYCGNRAVRSALWINLDAYIEDHKDSKDQNIETKYQYAMNLIDEEKYKEAKVILKEIYEYKDSAEKIEECDINIYARFKAAQVGDVITFGSYEQDNKLHNGQEDIEWIVLEKEGSNILVISKYGLDCQPYDEGFRSVTWETCTLRKWLNDDFVTTAFTAYEKGMIRTVTVSADKNPYYSTTPGNSTQDQVFLLSIKEAKTYFSSDDQRECEPTEYAVANGLRESDDGCCWWLRSPGRKRDKAASVSKRGDINEEGYFSCSYLSNVAVRPAMWIDFDS